jgi:bifunctional DNase/RNase
MKLVEVYVRGIAVDSEREHPVVLLKSRQSPDNDSVLPIWIGPAEATAIYTVLTGKSFERPMTHDLMGIILDVLGAEMSRIEITGIHKDTYFARIVLKQGKDEFYIDARPSDSIALALRADAPVFVDSELFDRYKRNIHIGKDGEEDDVRRRLEELDPGSFGDLDI